MSDATDRLWRIRWEAVLAYRERTGRWPGIRHEEPELVTLARWMAEQRSRHRQGRLEPDREAAMLAAGFDLNPGLGGGKRHYPPDMVEQLVSEYRAGASMQELPRKFRVSAATARVWVRAAGVQLRRGDHARFDGVRMLELSEQGLSHRQIAEQLGMKPNTVTVRLRRMRRQR